jgi:hypothetical protein
MEEEQLPRHIKAITTEGPFFDEAGGAYARVTVTFRWWYVPIALFIRWRSRPVAGFLE